MTIAFKATLSANFVASIALLTRYVGIKNGGQHAQTVFALVVGSLNPGIQ